MKNEPYFWYNLGYDFGSFDEKIHIIKMTFLHNFQINSYYVKLCIYIQQVLLKHLESELTAIVEKEYTSEYLPGYPDVMIKNIFKINCPINNDTTTISVISYPNKIPYSYKEKFEEYIRFMKSYINKIDEMFYKSSNKTVNQLVNGLEKLGNIIQNKRIYEDKDE